jgi:hypothetical protein
MTKNGNKQQQMKSAIVLYLLRQFVVICCPGVTFNPMVVGSNPSRPTMSLTLDKK